jgi:hypothetical protein
MVLSFAIPVTHGQQCFNDIEWKVPEIKSL